MGDASAVVGSGAFRKRFYAPVVAIQLRATALLQFAVADRSELGKLGWLSRCCCSIEVFDQHECLVVRSDGAQAHHSAPLKDDGLFNELSEVLFVFHTGQPPENCARPGQVHVLRASGCDGRYNGRGCTERGCTTTVVRTSQSRGEAAAIVTERVTFARLTGIAVVVVVVDTLIRNLPTLTLIIIIIIIIGFVRLRTRAVGVCAVGVRAVGVRAVGVRAVGSQPLSFPLWRKGRRTRSWCWRLHQCRARVGGLRPKP